MTVIKIENLWKQYRLGVIGHGALHKDLQSWWSRVRGKEDPNSKLAPFLKGQEKQMEGDRFWALRDINLEVRQGEILGIIGKNGAGKSTLLKILSRVTAPTRGEIKVKGRIASLLEVGTGFHPELTGRENIFLNGAILGMTKPEIRSKFDEIVDFSGVEQFIDTPVKRYSSGMHVRLAFAVAAHLEPEILVVDEVLAVGDAEFQKKCLGKMGEVAKEGRTVLFVSHNMGMINSLCRQAVLFDEGQVAFSGDVSKAINKYFSEFQITAHHVVYREGKKVGDEYATLLEAWVENIFGEKTGDIDIRDGFNVRMLYEIHKHVPLPPYPNFHFYDSQGRCVFVTGGMTVTDSRKGAYEAVCHIPGWLLNDGSFFIGLALTFRHAGIHVSFHEKDALAVIIRDPIQETVDNHRGGYSGPIPGVVRPQLQWDIQRLS